MDESNPQYMAFSDESRWSEGRFRTIGVVSLKSHEMKELEAKVANVTKGSDFGWKKDDGQMMAGGSCIRINTRRWTGRL